MCNWSNTVITPFLNYSNCGDANCSTALDDDDPLTYTPPAKHFYNGYMGVIEGQWIMFTLGAPQCRAE